MKYGDIEHTGRHCKIREIEAELLSITFENVHKGIEQLPSKRKNELDHTES